MVFDGTSDSIMSIGALKRGARNDPEGRSKIVDVCSALNQRHPVVVYWPSGFLEAYWFMGLAAEGGKANKPVFS